MDKKKIISIKDLGFQRGTNNPFLFCVHQHQIWEWPWPRPAMVHERSREDR